MLVTSTLNGGCGDSGLGNVPHKDVGHSVVAVDQLGAFPTLNVRRGIWHLDILSRG